MTGDVGDRTNTLASETDPVCGMRVDPERPRGGTATHAGKTYGFCNPRCRERFAADPERFLQGGAPRSTGGTAALAPGPTPHAPDAPSSVPPGGTVWVCPMDPEVQSDRSGACPTLRHGARAE